MAGGFGAKGRGGKKRLFDDRVPANSNGKEAVAARQRAEKLQAHINYQPRVRYPKIQYPVSPAPTARESVIIERWKANATKAREGPLFVRRVVAADARVAKPVATAASGFNAFNALPTYSAKYERRYRQRPKMDGKLWLKAILPQELWDVVDPTLRNARGNARANAEKSTAPGTTQIRFNLDDFSDNEDGANKDDDDENENNLNDSDAEAEAEAEEVDEDWEDDEDEGDDYNGEKYFDDGEKDDVVGDDYEAGDDMGGGEVEYEREFAPGEEFDV